MRVYLRTPNGRRKSFSLYKREILTDGSTKNVTLKNSDLENLNRANLPPDIALKNALEIKNRVEKSLGIDKGLPVHNEDNERILSQYWEQKYRRRNLIDPKTAKFELTRSVRSLKNVSLVSASAEEIEDAVKQHRWGGNKERRILGKIKLLLKFLGRDLDLVLPQPDEIVVSHISEHDFNVNLARIEDEYLKTLFYVLFYTGMRIREAFGLERGKVRSNNGYIIVDRQLDKHGKIRLPKNRKTRKTFVQGKVFSVILKWLDLRDTRRISHKMIYKACGKYFPGLTIHDLRHSYAIMLLAKGVPLAHVAQSLGNSVKVCEKYYTGHVLVDESIETMKRIVGE